jgi:plasmid maintenance system antidote protein VapI
LKFTGISKAPEGNFCLDVSFSAAFGSRRWKDYLASIRPSLPKALSCPCESGSQSQSGEVAAFVGEADSDPEAILANYDGSILIAAGDSGGRLCEPRYPGLVLMSFFVSRGIGNAGQAADQLGISAKLIWQLIHQERRISAGFSRRMFEVFGTPESFWSDLQRDYERSTTTENLTAGEGGSGDASGD